VDNLRIKTFFMGINGVKRGRGFLYAGFAQLIQEIYMILSTLPAWLDWIAGLHQNEMALGLERVAAVARNLGVLAFDCTIIIVGGTNGKGSTVAGLEAIYRAAGYRTGVFTSPILFKHNEQVRLNGQEATDDDFCHAFEKVEAVRGDVPLTPFEFATLAALVMFKKFAPDVLILEVGLGGRLDAVNILDADVAVVTSIGIDHVEWLGPTRESIAYEKAGIFRARKPAVCGDHHPPMSLLNYANEIGTPLFCQGQDFVYHDAQPSWSWACKQPMSIVLNELPRNPLFIQNMSTVLMVVHLLQDQRPVNREAIEQGLKSISLPGRIDVKPGEVTEVFDVSHNPDAVALLANYLRKTPCTGKTRAVFSMLADKDITKSIEMVCDQIDEWSVAPLQCKRAASAERLHADFESSGVKKMTMFTSIKEAYTITKQKAVKNDRMIIFGSFHTIAEALGEYSEHQEYNSGRKL
jgi:dihydrofolate synthase/folylpolyglutamate synthase